LSRNRSIGKIAPLLFLDDLRLGLCHLKIGLGPCDLPRFKLFCQYSGEGPTLIE
jgi:hypothetical protein